MPTATGEIATFAMITNGQPDTNVTWFAQTAVGEAIAHHRVVCDSSPKVPLVLPGAIYAGSMGTLAAFPLETVVIAGTSVPVSLLATERAAIVDRCLAADDDFEILLGSHLAPSGIDG